MVRVLVFGVGRVFLVLLAVGITSKNTMMAIVQAFCLLVFLGLTVWQLNHLTWSITDYRVRISSNLEKGAHVEQSEK